MARPTGFEPVTLGLAYPLRLSTPAESAVCGLDYLFTVSGAARIVSTEPSGNHQQNEHSALDYSSVSLPSM
jgi:hypothetical protein